MALWTPSTPAAQGGLSSPPDGWWDASDNSTLTLNGSTVSAWSNKGAFGGSLSQATASAQPGYSATGLNGMAALSFDGVDDYLGMAAAIGIAAAASATALMAGQKTNVQNTQWWGEGSSTSNNLLYSVGQQANGGNGVISPGLIRNDSNTTLVNNTVLSGLSPFDNTPHIFGFVDTGSTSAALADGSVQATPTSYTRSGTFTANRFAIGAELRAAANAFSALIAGEALFFKRVLTTDERQKLEGYLAWKWGTQAKLPASHPYASAAPQATGSTNATASGVLPSLASTAPTAAATGSGIASGALPSLASTAPTAVVQAYAGATGALPTSVGFALSALATGDGIPFGALPSGSSSAPQATLSGDGAATGGLPAVSSSAPRATAGGDGQAIGSLPAIASSAPTGVAGASSDVVAIGALPTAVAAAPAAMVVTTSTATGTLPTNASSPPLAAASASTTPLAPLPSARASSPDGSAGGDSGGYAALPASVATAPLGNVIAFVSPAQILRASPRQRVLRASPRRRVLSAAVRR